MAQKKTFEQNMKRLEEIVVLMEKPDCGIDALVKHYKEVASLSKTLGDALADYEQIITELVSTNNGLTEMEYNES